MFPEWPPFPKHLVNMHHGLNEDLRRRRELLLWLAAGVVAPLPFGFLVYKAKQLLKEEK